MQVRVKNGPQKGKEEEGKKNRRWKVLALPGKIPISGSEHCTTPLRDHSVFESSRKEPRG